MRLRRRRVGWEHDAGLGTGISALFEAPTKAPMTTCSTPSQQVKTPCLRLCSDCYAWSKGRATKWVLCIRAWGGCRRRFLSRPGPGHESSARGLGARRSFQGPSFQHVQKKRRNHDLQLGGTSEGQLRWFGWQEPLPGRAQARKRPGCRRHVTAQMACRQKSNWFTLPACIGRDVARE